MTKPKLKLLEMKMTSSGAQPPMVDADDEILKVEYLRDHWLDRLQNLNLKCGTKPELKITWKEDDIKILKF